MAKTEFMSPYQAKTFDQVCRLQRDNKDFSDADGDWGWILVQAGDEYHEVCIHQQKPGEESKQNITIPRKVFIRMARWYMRPQKLRKKA